MKTIHSLVVSLLLSVGAAQAATENPAAPAAKKALSTSQERMVQCNKDASGKKGEERKTFMRECMQAGKSGSGTQQNRMKECNQEAGGMKGPERRTFMSECLKKKPA